MNTKKHVLLICGFIAVAAYGQGPLTPPGAPDVTMKTLDQVEPRTPISISPYTITQSGSYYLTTNLYASGTNNAISVLANDVTIDLAGFTLVGPGAGSSWSGIDQPAEFKNLCVYNGRLTGWYGPFLGGIFAMGENNQIRNVQVGGSYMGIRVGDGGVVRECSVSSNYYGIVVGFGGLIAGCVALSNTSEGISIGSGCIQDCTALANQANGFSCYRDTYISRCVANDNGHHGIYGIYYTSVKDCSANSNIVSGIYLSDGGFVSSCSVVGNGANGVDVAESSQVLDTFARNNQGRGITGGYQCSISRCTVFNNGDDGIYVSFGSSVSDCTSGANTNIGILVTQECLVLNNHCYYNNIGIDAGGSANRIDGNNVDSNGTGINTGANSLLVRNSARGNGVNYTNAPGASVAEIVNVVGGGFTNTNPWANFIY